MSSGADLSSPRFLNVPNLLSAMIIDHCSLAQYGQYGQYGAPTYSSSGFARCSSEPLTGPSPPEDTGADIARSRP